MNILLKNRKKYLGVLIVGILSACATIEDQSVPVNLTVLETIPKGAAENYLEKVTSEEWKNHKTVFIPYPICHASKIGIERTQGKQGFFELDTHSTKTLETIPYDEAEYYFVHINNEEYEIVLDHNKRNLACKFIRNRKINAENEELVTKIITAFEALNIPRRES